MDEPDEVEDPVLQKALREQKRQQMYFWIAFEMGKVMQRNGQLSKIEVIKALPQQFHHLIDHVIEIIRLNGFIEIVDRPEDPREESING